MTTRDRLTPESRAEALRRIGATTVDVLVIGGGVTGCGAALDAATRGLSVALVEAGDLAAGTSSRSGKTFHGGLRYLEALNFSLVRQALHERDLMVQRLCPHLARPQPFLYPLVHRGWERAYVGCGVALYDLLGGARHGIPHHRHLTRSGALREAPALRPDRLVGAVQYYDVRVDDARHTMLVARTAARYGALVASRAAAVGIRPDGDEVVVRVRDAETGAEIAARARSVVNAAGVWVDEVQAFAGAPTLKVQPAKGIHLVVPREKIDSRTGIITRTPDSVLIVRPWWRHWIIGTTDTPWDGDRGAPSATSADVDYLLGQVNGWLRTPLTRADIVGVYAGLRPLLAGRGTATAALSRDHDVIESSPRVFTIAGGKYTTYRAMARDVVDAATARIGSRVPASCTERIPLLGAAGWSTAVDRTGATAQATRLSDEQVTHLLDRYGALTDDLLDLAADRPELAAPLPGAPGYLGVEAHYAASHEGALHLDDVLVRRTHISIETRDHGRAAAGPVADIVAAALGWDDARRDEEVARYLAEDTEQALQEAR